MPRTAPGATLTAATAGSVLTASTAPGAGGTAPGNYVNNMYRAVAADFNAQSALWTALSGSTVRAARYYKALSDFTYSADMAEMTAAGVKICLTLRPAYNPVSATDLANMTTLLATMQAAGTRADIALWHEPFFGGLTSTQFNTMIQYYGPTVRQYYPLVFVGSGPDLILGNGYYTGDAWFDKIACDQYAFGTVSPDPGSSIDNAAAIADAAVPRKPLGLWEFNGSTDAVSGQTQAFVTTWLGNVQAFFTARLAAGKANADLILFNSGTGNWLGNATGANCGFEGGTGNWVVNLNCAIAGTAAQAYEGTGALAVTSASTSVPSVGSCAPASITTQGMPCAAGNSVVLGGQFRAATVARNVRIGAQFWNSGGGFISTVLAGSAPADSTTAWTLVTATVTAPAAAAFARWIAQWETPAGAGEVQYVDNASIYVAQPGNSLNTTIWSANDYRIPLYNALYTALNAVPVPASLTSSDTALGTLSGRTAP